MAFKGHTANARAKKGIKDQAIASCEIISAHAKRNAALSGWEQRLNDLEDKYANMLLDPYADKARTARYAAKIAEIRNALAKHGRITKDYIAIDEKLKKSAASINELMRQAELDAAVARVVATNCFDDMILAPAERAARQNAEFEYGQQEILESVAHARDVRLAINRSATKSR